MIKFLSDIYATFFSFLCFIVLAVFGIALIYALSGGYDSNIGIPGVILAFIVFVLLVGFLATILDLRNCVRQLVEFEKQKREEN